MGTYEFIEVIITSKYFHWQKYLYGFFIICYYIFIDIFKFKLFTYFEFNEITHYLFTNLQCNIELQITLQY